LVGIKIVVLREKKNQFSVFLPQHISGKFMPMNFIDVIHSIQQPSLQVIKVQIQTRFANKINAFPLDCNKNDICTTIMQKLPDF